MALQTLVANTPAPTALFLNNQRIDIKEADPRPLPRDRYAHA